MQKSLNISLNDDGTYRLEYAIRTYRHVINAHPSTINLDIAEAFADMKREEARQEEIAFKRQRSANWANVNADHGQEFANKTIGNLKAERQERFRQRAEQMRQEAELDGRSAAPKGPSNKEQVQALLAGL